VLHSSNINVTILDKTVKNRTYRLLLTDKLRTFKKDYLGINTKDTTKRVSYREEENR
jgi:hypothetical protein